MPWEKRFDDTCDTLIEVLLRWVPGVSWFWDFSAELPTLKFCGFDAAPAATFTGTSPATLRLAPNRRFDMLVERVEIFYLRNFGLGEVMVGSDTFGPVHPQTPDGEDIIANNPLSLSILLQEDEPVPESGLAAIYGAYLARLHADLDFELPAWAWELEIGTVYQFGGVLAHLRPAASQVQLITQNLFTGFAAVQAGVPRHLGIHDLLTLAKLRARSRQINGGGGTPVAQEDTPPEWGPCTVNVSLKDYQNNEIPGAYVMIKDATISNGASASFEMTASAENNVEVFVFLPAEFKPLNDLTVNLLAGSNVLLSETAEYQDELKIRKSVGEPEGEHHYAKLQATTGGILDLRQKDGGTDARVLLDVTDLPEGTEATPAKPLLIKLRSVSIPGVGKVVIAASEPPNPTGTTRGFALLDASEEGEKKIRVSDSVVNGERPTGFSALDDPPFLLSGISGSGKVWVKIGVDLSSPSTAQITSRTVENGATKPADTDSAKYVLLGDYSVTGNTLTVANTGGCYGPISVEFCRLWFNASAPYWSVGTRYGGA